MYDKLDSNIHAHVLLSTHVRSCIFYCVAHILVSILRTFLPKAQENGSSMFIFLGLNINELWHINVSPLAQ